MKTQLGMSRSELLALPAMIDIVTAGRACRLGRTKSYELARSDQFPVTVHRVGASYRVATVDVLRFLGMAADTEMSESQHVAA